MKDQQKKLTKKSMTSKHTPVLLNEVIRQLNVKSDGVYLDATIGFGGHSSIILSKLKLGYLFGIDQDNVAIEHSKLKLAKISKNFKIIKDNFKNIDDLDFNKIKEFDGILFDLGISSLQIDEAKRGFSFKKNARLDMRMDQSQELDAFKIVNNYSQEQLAKMFYEYGEDKFAKKIAEAICIARQDKPIKTTIELVNIIKKVKPLALQQKKHPAKQIFQALRIEVNDELNAIKQAMNHALKMLKIEGRLVVITFHSLEDKVVKEIFIKAKNIKEETLKEIKVKYKTFKTIYPTKEELLNNSRAKSAKLRTLVRKY